MGRRIHPLPHQRSLFRSDQYGGYIIMGIWDKDKSFAKDGPLKDWAGVGNKFILWGAEMVNPVFETNLGTAPMVHLDVSNLGAPDNHSSVSVIGDTIGGKFFDKDD